MPLASFKADQQESGDFTNTGIARRNHDIRWVGFREEPTGHPSTKIYQVFRAFCWVLWVSYMCKLFRSSEFTLIFLPWPALNSRIFYGYSEWLPERRRIPTSFCWTMTGILWKTSHLAEDNSDHLVILSSWSDDLVDWCSESWVCWTNGFDVYWSLLLIVGCSAVYVCFFTDLRYGIITFSMHSLTIRYLAVASAAQ